jgi:hypothetical protein
MNTKYQWAVNKSKLERAIKKGGTTEVEIRAAYELLGGLVDVRYWNPVQETPKVAEVITPEETEVLVASIQEPVLTPKSPSKAKKTLSAKTPEGVLTQPTTDDIATNN